MVFKNPFTISLKNKNEDSKSYLQYNKRLKYKTKEKNLHVHCDLTYFKEFCF